MDRKELLDIGNVNGETYLEGFKKSNEAFDSFLGDLERLLEDF